MNIAIAFAAGLFSFFSPCIFPIIPSYILFLAGLTVGEFSKSENKSSIRKQIMLNSILFVLGFSLVFIAMGATASSVGHVFSAVRGQLRMIGGVMIMAFGLYIMGVFDWLTLFNFEKKYNMPKPAGYLGAFVMGLTFAAAWSPCVGPILGSILVLAGTSDTMVSGMVLLTFYSLSGLFLVFVGLLVLFNQLQKISSYISW